MRIGDQLTVSLEGIGVAYATIEAIEDNKATIIIPATRVVMGIKSSLEPATPEVERTNTVLTEDPNASAKSELEADYDSAFDTKRESAVEYAEPTTSLRNMDFDSSAID
jgi:hypothetical protein